MNPCPCEYFNDKSRVCFCTAPTIQRSRSSAHDPVPMIQRYAAKISAPLLDRIDIHIEVPAVQGKELRGAAAEMRERALAARERQRDRLSSS